MYTTPFLKTRRKFVFEGFCSVKTNHSNFWDEDKIQINTIE